MKTDQPRVIESPTGQGEIIKKGKTVAVALYTLAITEKKTGAGKGRQSVTGELLIVQGESNLLDGSAFVLKLRDGRRWPFYVRSGNPVSKIYQCVGRGNFKKNAPAGGASVHSQFLHSRQ